MPSVLFLDSAQLCLRHDYLRRCCHSDRTYPDDATTPQKEKPKYEPPPPTTRVGKKKKRSTGGPDSVSKLPAVFPNSRCKLKMLRMDRIKDHLLLEEAFVETQERLRSRKGDKGGVDQRQEEERSRVDDMRGSPMGVGNLEEMIDDDHAIVSSTTGPEYGPRWDVMNGFADGEVQVLRFNNVLC